MDEDSVDLHKDPEAAEEMAANAVIRYLHECGVEGDRQKRQWITRVFDQVIARELTH